MCATYEIAKSLAPAIAAACCVRSLSHFCLFSSVLFNLALFTARVDVFGVVGVGHDSVGIRVLVGVGALGAGSGCGLG